MSVTDDLKQRVARLERSAVRARRVALALAAVLATVLLMGQGGSRDPEDLVGRTLTLKDSAGRVRLRIQFERDSPASPPAMEFFDKRGKSWLRAGRTVDKTWFAVRAPTETGSCSFTLERHNGTPQVSLAADRVRTELIMEDRDGARRVHLGSVVKAGCALALMDREQRAGLMAQADHNQGPSMHLWEASAVRAALGRVVFVKGEREMVTREHGITLLDAEQNVIWSQPEK